MTDFYNFYKQATLIWEQDKLFTTYRVEWIGKDQ